MRTVFADSYFFIALLSEKDLAHAKAMAACHDPTLRILTTEWILLEVADGMARSRDRSKFIQFIRQLPYAPNIRTIPATTETLRRGLDHYCLHADKEWSLTDSISFVVVMDEGITEALTADHHFEQAGFTALLK